MAKDRTEFIQIRVTAEEKAAIKKIAEDTGRTVTDLLIEASGRVRPWSPSDRKLEQERIREVARIGANLNQIARWANTYKSTAEAIQILVQLKAIEECISNIKAGE